MRDLFAYLKTLPAVQAASKPHDVPFPFNIRRTLGGWKFLFLDGKPFEPDPAKDAAWNRGAYLVNGPGHCAECHSPRNILGGIVASQRFAGGPEPGGDGFVPNITQKGLSMSHEELVKLLATGETPDGDTVGGEMAKVVANTGKLSAEDRAAIATYIKSLPPVEGPKPPEHKSTGTPPLDESASRPSCSRPSRRCCSRCCRPACAISASRRCRSARWCSSAPPSPSCRCC